MASTSKGSADGRGSLFERLFEGFLWRARFSVLIPVLLGLVGTAVLFFIASVDVLHVVVNVVRYYLHHAEVANVHEQALGMLIGAVDLYLIGIVLLIFSFGLYELFVSEVEAASAMAGTNPLKVHSLEDLKSKIMKVVVIVLVVKFFQAAIAMKFERAMDLMMLALGILAICIGMYFLHKEE